MAKMSNRRTIEQKVAEHLVAALTAQGIIDDFDELIGDRCDTDGKVKTLRYAKELAEVIDWMNDHLPKKQRVSKGSTFIEDAKRYLCR